MRMRPWRDDRWCLIALLLAFSTTVMAQSRERPASLEAFAAARGRINASMSILSYGKGGTPNRMRSTVTGAEVVVFRDGTVDGKTSSAEDGTPHFGLEGVSMRTRDSVWNKKQRSSASQVDLTDEREKQAAFVFDYRTIGMLAAPVAAQFQSPPGRVFETVNLASDTTSPLYEEEIDDSGLHVVRRLTQNGEECTTWYLDPELDFNAVRVEQVIGGKRFAATSLEYEFKTDVWVPVRVSYEDIDGEVASVTELIYHAVNTPEVPKRLSPETIGVYRDSAVNVQGAGQHYWGGDRLISMSEFSELYRAGDIEIDPRVGAIDKRQNAEQQKRLKDGRLPATTSEMFGTPYEPIPEIEAHWKDLAPRTDSSSLKSRIEKFRRNIRGSVASQPIDPWDHYVEQFIREYALDDDQTQKCILMLGDAKQQRDAHLNKNREKLEKLITRPAETVNEVARLEETLRVILRPAEQIFERLKKRLMTAPTRDQIAARDAQQSSPSSAPARQNRQPSASQPAKSSPGAP